jgi:hypothetical protein
MLRELLPDLKSAGFNVVSLSGGLVVSTAAASVTIGHEASGFTTYVQTGTNEDPVYSGEDGLTKAQVIAVCQSVVMPVAS